MHYFLDIKIRSVDHAQVESWFCKSQNLRIHVNNLHVLYNPDSEPQYEETHNCVFTKASSPEWKSQNCDEMTDFIPVCESSQTSDIPEKTGKDVQWYWWNDFGWMCSFQHVTFPTPFQVKRPYQTALMRTLARLLVRTLTPNGNGQFTQTNASAWSILIKVGPVVKIIQAIVLSQFST